MKKKIPEKSENQLSTKLTFGILKERVFILNTVGKISLQNLKAVQHYCKFITWYQQFFDGVQNQGYFTENFDFIFRGNNRKLSLEYVWKYGIGEIGLWKSNKHGHAGSAMQFSRKQSIKIVASIIDEIIIEPIVDGLVRTNVQSQPTDYYTNS